MRASIVGASHRCAPSPRSSNIGCTHGFHWRFSPHVFSPLRGTHKQSREQKATLVAEALCLHLGFLALVDCRQCSFYGHNGVITKRPNLPDFGKFFRTNSRSPIDFACRDAPNLLHDMVFLRSYLHDAAFEIGKIHRTGNLLRIPLQRDRWERYKPSRALEKIASSLVISPVLVLKWESMSKPGRKQKARHSNRFYIRDI